MLISILIRRDTPGPVFYRGKRAGRNGRVFEILKFRTMFEDPECYEGPKVTAQDDPRITPLGKWLRDTKLNELPQFWNVLKGEMSLVGPRPEDPDIAASWPEDVRKEVLSVRPGVTSPASVLYRNEESLLEKDQVMQTYLDQILPSKLRLDQLYVRNRSIWLDLDILFWASLVLLPKIGSFSPPEDLLFLGPISRLMRRYVSWFIIDLLVTFAAFAITGGLWRSFAVLNVGWTRAVLAAVGFSLVFSLSGALLGVNRITWSKASSVDALDLVLPTVTATSLAVLLNWWIGTLPLILYPGTTGFLPAPMVLVGSALSFGGFVTIRYRSRILSGMAYRWSNARHGAVTAREKVLIIGGGTTGQFVAWFLNNGEQLNVFHVVGFIDDDLYMQGTRVQGVQVLGKRDDICNLVEQYDIGIIVFAIHNIGAAEKDALMKICASTQARTVMMPDILAALNAAIRGSRNGGNGHKGPVDPAADFGDAPMIWPGIPPQQVAAWFAEIENLSQAGDLAGLQSRVRDLGSQLQASGIWVAQPGMVPRSSTNGDNN
jgi:lipopolysaccharide/colanic/teichoic acid biosynthesis glycosyltransferase